MSESRSRPRLDDVDRKIIRAFRVGARLSNSEIAREVQVSEATVRRRIASLAEAGVLKFVAILDPAMIGLRVDTLIGLQVRAARVEQVAEEIASFEEVRYTGISMGSFDVWVDALFASTEAWAAFRQRLGAIDGVTRVETFQITDVLKSNWDWVLPDSWR
jgi:Lrp/AsnC family transcriptional regulator for asnA, asnC and gidA